MWFYGDVQVLLQNMVELNGTVPGGVVRWPVGPTPMPVSELPLGRLAVNRSAQCSTCCRSRMPADTQAVRYGGAECRARTVQRIWSEIKTRDFRSLNEKLRQANLKTIEQ